MATITLENVPEKFVKQYGAHLNFSEFSLAPKGSYKAIIESEGNTTYGPLSGQEFIAEMKTW